MRMPIDVIYIDDNDRVVDIDPAMAAWRIGRARKSASYVVEVPSGAAERTGCAIGDQLFGTDGLRSGGCTRRRDR